MLSYCRSDVDILRWSSLEFRAQFMEIADVDPFRYVTIASVCMAAFRSNQYQTDMIAMVLYTATSTGRISALTLSSGWILKPFQKEFTSSKLSTGLERKKSPDFRWMVLRRNKYHLPISDCFFHELSTC